MQFDTDSQLYFHLATEQKYNRFFIAFFLSIFSFESNPRKCQRKCDFERFIHTCLKWFTIDVINLLLLHSFLSSFQWISYSHGLSSYRPLTLAAISIFLHSPNRIHIVLYSFDAHELLLSWHYHQHHRFTSTGNDLWIHLSVCFSRRENHVYYEAVVATS